MNRSLRFRIALTLLPLLGLVSALGVAGFVLLSRLSGRIDVILRENYDSVLYMEHLNEALERIDSGFQFALAGQEREGKELYADKWPVYLDNLHKEQNNVTVPGEGELVQSLAALTSRFHELAEEFFRTADERARKDLYFRDGSRPGLFASFKQIKDVSGQILRLNQQNMEEASRQARATANASRFWFGAALAAAAVLAVLGTVQTARTILQPIQAVTESARAIGAGNLDQVVPIPSKDELGELAAAFNSMARQLRGFRQSQQARMLRLQQTSQAAINALPHPVLVVNPVGRVELANPAMQGALGVFPSAAAPATALAWQPPEPLRQPLLDALQSQRAYMPEGFDRAISLRTGAQERFYLPRILPISDADGITLGAALLLEDVTRFRLLDEVKSNLVATASHELKTPLTSLRLAVHLLIEEAVGPLTPKQLELLLDARENTERLLDMINNLLDLARLQEGNRQLRLQPEDPGQLLRRAAEAIGPRAEDKHIAVALSIAPDLPAVNADAEEMHHALGNLLDNALRHLGSGGKIELAAEALPAVVLLTVSDNGSGIPAEYMPHLFEKFFRVPEQNPGTGTGLGLAIVRDILRAHGGDVTCESQPGAGATFRLTLPRADRQPAAQEPRTN